jgi:hypothetical protein
MLVSKAETFWVGLVRGLLEVEPLEQPSCEDFPPEDYPRPHYVQIVRFAELCKIGTPPTREQCAEDALDLDPMALRWTWRSNGEPLDSSEVQEATVSLREAARFIVEQASQLDWADAATCRFEELAAKEAVFSGYNPATPALQYSVCRDGAIRITGRIRPIAPGLLHIVLRLLSKHLEFPVVAHIALAATDPHGPGCERLMSSVRGLNDFVGTTDAKAALEAIDRELIGTAHADDALRLGQELGIVLRVLDQIGLWLSEELRVLAGATHATSVIEFIPAAQQDQVDDVEEIDRLDLDGDSDKKQSDDELSRSDSQHSDGNTKNTWEEDALSLFKRACLQVGLGIEVPQLDSPTRPHLRRIKTRLEEAIPQAKRLRSDALVDMLTRGSALVSAILNEGRAAPTRTKADTLDVMFGNREKLMGLAAELESLLLSVFTELKLREILSLETIGGLTPEALEGWKTLATNGRDTVREGMAMMANGVSPYVVINALQPMLESIVKKLADRNRIRPHGMSLSELLHTIMSRARAKGDEDLLGLASVGMAMRRPRNNAVHEDDREYDKHDAAFFLNGLAILLRGLM